MMVNQAESAAPYEAVEELGAQIGRLVLASKKQDEASAETMRAWQVLTAALEAMDIDWQGLLVSGPPQVDEVASDGPEGDDVTTDSFELDDGVQSTLTDVVEGKEG